jgi:hypothetical protein
LHLRIALLQEKALESLVYDLRLSRVSVVVDLAQFTHLAKSYRLSPDNRTPELELQSLNSGVLRTRIG